MDDEELDGRLSAIEARVAALAPDAPITRHAANELIRRGVARAERAAAEAAREGGDVYAQNAARRRATGRDDG